MAINLGNIIEENKKKKQQRYEEEYENVNGLRLKKGAGNIKLQRNYLETQHKNTDLGAKLNANAGKSSGGVTGNFLTDMANAGMGLLASAADVGLDILEGGLKTAEGVIDWGAYRTSDFLDWIGLGGLGTDLRQRADFDSTGVIFGHNQNVQQNILGNWQSGIEEASYVPDWGDNIAQSLGQIGAYAATAAATGGGSLALTGKAGAKAALTQAGITYTSAYGNARSEAKRQGLSDRDANRAGIIGGISETISENLFAGAAKLPVLGGFGSKAAGKLTGKIANAAEKYFGTNAGKIAYKVLENATESAGEGFEEIISNMLNAVGTDLMHNFDSNYTYGMENLTGNLLEDALNQWTSGDSWQQFFSAVMSSAIAGGGRGLINAKTQNKIINAYAQDNNMSFKDAKYILTGIQEQARENAINSEEVEYNSNAELNEIAKNRALNYMNETNTDTINKEIALMEQEQGKEFTQEERQQLFDQLKSRTEQEINEPDRGRSFTLEKEPTDEYNKQLYEEMKSSGVNNTKKAHNLYNLMSKIHEINPNSNIGMTSNEDLYQKGILEKQETTDENGNPVVKYGRTIEKDGKQQFVEETINGYNTGNGILINANGVNAMESTIWHEIAHSIKDTTPDGYDALKTIVREVYGENDYQKNIDYYKSLYGDNQNLEDEYINDKLGEMLNNKDFVNKISGNKGLLQTVIDKIKNMVKYITSSDEQKKLMKLQKELENKYIELYKKADFSKGNESASFSLSKNDKQNQLDIILNENPMQDDYHTGIRTIDDIKTLEETLNDSDYEGYDEFNPDLTRQDIENAIKKGTITIYSSYPIENGVFVSPSKMEAESYSGNGKIYSKEVSINDVAWIDPTQGQYAKVSDTKYSLSQEQQENINKFTDNGIIMSYVRNPQSNANQYKEHYKNVGLDFGQDIEPSGEYMSMDTLEGKNKIDGYEYGYIDFKNPLVIDNADTTSNGWKKDLSNMYNGLTGQKLSNAIMQDGYDAVMSRDNNGNIVEVVNLNGTKINDQTKYSSNPDIRYSLSQDSQGRELSKEQQDFFKDSKVRDDEGRLLEVYHGTPNVFWNSKENKSTPFYEFKQDMGGSGEGTNVYGRGFYFTEDRNIALEYSDEIGDGSYGHVYDVYLNIKNPFYATRDYKGKINTTLLKEQGYDGVIINKSSGNEYVVFNSNQIKNIDNTNPTINEDIRYQLQQEASQRGYGTYTEDITNYRPNRNLPMLEEINLPVQEEAQEELPFYETEEEITQTANDRMNERRRKLADKRFADLIEKQSYKAVNAATKVAKNYLDFNQKQTQEFKNKLSELAKMPKDNLIESKNYFEVKDAIKQYANKDLTFINQDIKDAQKDVRNRQLIVSNDLKAQITDWSDFRKASGLNIRNGQMSNVDTIYEELSDMYPEYFSKEVTNYADQIQELSDFLKRDARYTEHYELSDNTINQITNNVWEKLSQNALTKQEINDLQEEINKRVEARTREVVREDLLNRMGITQEDLQVGKDIGNIAYQRTDPKRVMEKVFGWQVGQKMNDALVNFAAHRNAEQTRWANAEKSEIKDLGIKARSKESAAVQKYGEGQYVNDKGEVVEYNDHNLMAEFPDVRTQEKIKNAARVLRQKYDAYIDTANPVLEELGYDPIPKRKDYFRHFNELQDKFSQWGIPFNRESMSSENLPTDINGLTDQFKPGKNFFASALQRKGMKTTYDAITGIDQYIDGIGNLIYQTETIQRYRAVSKLVRDTYGQTHGLEDIDTMTPEQAQQRIEDVYANKLSGFAAWLDEQANSIAGKKGGIDRAAERFMGRKIYTGLNNIKKQVGSNMTGYNVRSAMTNFASAVQGASKTNKLAFMEGTAWAMKNIVKTDTDLINKSDFLTNRYGTEQLSKKRWQKISEAGQVFMNATDSFTSKQIWGGKYFEGLHNGLTQEAAIKQADDFASRIMGDRSKGQTAEIFNSKTLGLLTQFQLEVNNQWSSMIHDNRMQLQKNGGLKTATGVISQLGQLYAMSWLFNNLMKAVTGSDVMFDPIDMLMKFFNPDDDKSLEERATSLLGDVVDQLPMASIFTGGRIPISEAFQGLTTTANYLTGKKDKYGNAVTLEDVKNDLIGSAAYYLFPTGYGQLKKTTQGLMMYDDNLPIKGSYTNSGRLRFEADTSPLGMLQAAVFGRNASANAREYYDKGYNTLTEKQINEAKDMNLPVSEYRLIKEGLKEQDSTEDKVDYIYNLPLTEQQKNVLVNNTLNRKNEIDLSNYGDYNSLDEFDYANKNPEKYEIITQITDYSTYQSYKADIDNIKDKYSKTEERKTAVFNYINSLPLNKYQKIMLQKMAGGYSIKSYKDEMFDYIDSLDLSKKEKEQIDKELFG